ncbi:unnamed protein product [Tilletia caries]|nr:unnamed protein product [Tilletia caries]
MTEILDDPALGGLRALSRRMYDAERSTAPWSDGVNLVVGVGAKGSSQLELLTNPTPHGLFVADVETIGRVEVECKRRRKAEPEAELDLIGDVAVLLLK